MENDLLKTENELLRTQNDLLKEINQELMLKKVRLEESLPRTREQIEERICWLEKAVQDRENEHNFARFYAQINALNWVLAKQIGL